MDLLHHEVRIAALFRGGHLPGDVLGDLFDPFTQGVIENGAVCAEIHHVAVVEIDHLAGVLQNSGHVGGDEILALAETENQRAVFLHRQHSARAVHAQDSQSVAASHFFNGPLHGADQVALQLVVVLKQVGDDLRVRIGFKGLAHGLQVFLQDQVVFDDAVMYHADLAVGRHMGVGVFVRGRAVGGPAGMADAQAAAKLRAAVGQFAEG